MCWWRSRRQICRFSSAVPSRCVSIRESCHHTKDLDIFTRPEDYPHVLEKLAGLGYRTEVTDLEWLAKAFSDEDYVDIIFGSGKGFSPVDNAWFEHAVEGRTLDMQVRLIPVEEMTWSKAFIMERERYDGADVAHLLRARGAEMDWPRLLQRFGVHWRVLFSHLILFHYIYPGERSQIPGWVLDELVRRLQEGPSKLPSAGSSLSRDVPFQYAVSHRSETLGLSRWAVASQCQMTLSQVFLYRNWSGRGLTNPSGEEAHLKSRHSVGVIGAAQPFQQAPTARGN